MVIRLGLFWMFDFKIATLISQYLIPKTPVVSLYEDIMNSSGDICIKLSPQSFLYYCKNGKAGANHAWSSELVHISIKGVAFLWLPEVGEFTLTWMIVSRLILFRTKD